MVRLLVSSLKFDHEIIIVHDTLKDNALEEANKLKKEFSNIKNSCLRIFVFRNFR
jgi:hypothetical protein